MYSTHIDVCSDRKTRITSDVTLFSTWRHHGLHGRKKKKGRVLRAFINGLPTYGSLPAPPQLQESGRVQ